MTPLKDRTKALGFGCILICLALILSPPSSRIVAQTSKPRALAIALQTEASGIVLPQSSGAPANNTNPQHRISTGWDVEMPETSDMDSMTPHCHKLQPRTDICYINWYDIAVQVDDPISITSITIKIDGKMRANYQGFFQSNAYISNKSNGLGFQVSCGYEGADGYAGLGYRHTYAISYVNSLGNGELHTGYVHCPANNLLPVYLPLLSK